MPIDMEAAARLRANGAQKPRIWVTAPPDGLTLTVEQWEACDLPEPDFILGEMLSTTARAIIIGPTGLGKTMFAQAIGFALANGEGFLHWAGPSRPLRVLYVDGEMSRRQMKRRILDALRRSGGKKPEFLFVLSKEDAESLPPLNTPEGQAWMDTFIEQHGGFDLIIFDNLQSLLTGNMKDEEQWAEVLPWVQDLTRRAIGQVWLHHTGHEEGRGYGSKAREWGMDLVGLMERVANTPKGELWFSLKFTKARERGPENLDDFDEVTLKLIDDKWSSDKGKIAPGKSSLRGGNRIAYEALCEAIIKEGKAPPYSKEIPDNTHAVHEDVWRRYAYGRGISSSDEPAAKKKAFGRARTALQEMGKIGVWEGQVWATAGEINNTAAQEGGDKDIL